jgi:hypothetical protein
MAAMLTSSLSKEDLRTTLVRLEDAAAVQDARVSSILFLSKVDLP